MVECHTEVSVFLILICILYLSIVDLQCCASFKCTAKSLLSVPVYPFFFRFFSRIGYFRILSRAQWKVKVKVTQLYLILCDPMDYPVHGILQARILQKPFPSPGDPPNPGIKPRSPALQADSLLSEPPGKPKNTGVGSISFLHGTSPPRNQIRASCITGGFLQAELPRKPSKPINEQYKGWNKGSLRKKEKEVVTDNLWKQVQVLGIQIGLPACAVWAMITRITSPIS